MRRSDEVGQAGEPDGVPDADALGPGSPRWMPTSVWSSGQFADIRGAHAVRPGDWQAVTGAGEDDEASRPAPRWSDDLDLAGLRPPPQGRVPGEGTASTAAPQRDSGPRAGVATGGLREALSSPGSALEFARRHLAIIVVALVVAVGIAATHLFRAGSQAVPVGATIATPATTGATAGNAARQASGVAGSTTSAGYSASAGHPSAATSASANPNLTVQVLGPVRHPGVVTLHPGSRVKDAIMACGGLLSSADPAELNLAAPLQDADQVIIGTRAHPRGEVRRGTDAQDPGTAATGTSGTATGAAAASSASAGVVVNLNTATLAQLDAIAGIGPVTAQKIIDWRTQHGRFTSANELQEVDGIGPKSFARIAPHVTV